MILSITSCSYQLVRQRLFVTRCVTKKNRFLPNQNAANKSHVEVGVAGGRK